MRLMTKAPLYIIIFLWGGLACYAGPPDWNVNPADFEFNMNGTIRVKTDSSTFLNEPNTMIGVFVNGETRGVVESEDIIFIGDDAYFPVTMYSNEQEGDTMNFKVYVASTDSIYDANETAIFNRVLTLGTPAEPFILTIGSSCVDVLILGSDASPLSGIFKAGSEIRLQGNISVPNGATLILDAPVVRSQNILNLDASNTLIIRGDGCN